MRRLGFLAGPILVLALVSPVRAAGGAHTQSYTDNFHGTQSATQVNPCTGNPDNLSETTNSVEHVTYFPASDESWGTFTEEDSITGIDTVTGVTYTGHAMFWGNFNVNRQNSNFTFTSAVRATGSNGSTMTIHEVGHMTMLPDGNVAVAFDKPSVTCS